jgi:hypothetical protein
MTRLPLDSRLDPERLGALEPSAILLAGALILVSLAFLVLLRWTSAQAGGDEPRGGTPPGDSGWRGRGPDDGGPRTDGPPDPSGGVPLPDARPARVRLRGDDVLRDGRGRPARRRVDEPERQPVSRPDRRG